MPIDDNADLATLDRGNTLPEPDPAIASAAAAAAQAATDKAAAEAAAAEALVKTPEPTDAPAATPEEENATRDPATGKFAKKERPDANGIMLTKARFDEQVGKERTARLAAEQALSALQAKIDTAVHGVDVEKLETEVAALEKLHTKHMMDGDADKAAEAMRDIRLKERAIRSLEDDRKQAERYQAQSQEQLVEEERQRVGGVIKDLEAAHPEFVEGGEQFNQKLVNIVLAEQMRLINEEKLSPSVALARAAADIMEIRGKPAGLGAAADVAAGKGTEAERKAAAVAKNVATAKAQPGSMKEVGLDSDKAGSKSTTEEASKMTYEEFEALPESTRAKMRGDSI